MIDDACSSLIGIIVQVNAASLIPQTKYFPHFALGHRIGFSCGAIATDDLSVFSGSSRVGGATENRWLQYEQVIGVLLVPF